MPNREIRQEGRLGTITGRLDQHGTDRAVKVRLRGHGIARIIDQTTRQRQKRAKLVRNGVERLDAEAVEVLVLGNLEHQIAQGEIGENLSSWR